MLETRYLNLNLKNPIIVASSGLTKTVEKMEECEHAGAGAVVIKSLFEEALANDDWGIEYTSTSHTEAFDYLYSDLQLEYGPNEYCDLIKQAKRKLSIPVIASINCVTDQWWPSFARNIEDAGADALELNIFTTPLSKDINGKSIENLYLNIVKKVRQSTNIPIAVKISTYFSSIPNFSAQLEECGASGIVLFNRFIQPDIDIHKKELKSLFNFTTSYDSLKVLRWVAILSANITADLSATTGIKTSDDTVKMLLAGASTVQLASVLYEKGLKEIKTIINGVEEWMKANKYESIIDFRGKLNFSKVNKPEEYLRSQFIETIREKE